MEESITRSRSPSLMVYLCGIGTIGLTLFLVGFLNGTDFNIMGWYWLFIIPIGAILVGLVAGSGYAVGSLITDVKVRRGFLIVIFLTAIVNWFASHWVTYQHLLEQVEEENRGGISFLSYLQFLAESFSFKSRGGEEGKPFGKFGYAFILLEMGGFALGSIIPVYLVGLKPYCHNCGRYLKKHVSRPLPSTLQKKDLKKLKKDEKAERISEAIEEVATQAQAVVDDILESDFTDTARRIEAIPDQKSKSSLAIAWLHLKKCPACDGHHLQVSLFNHTVGGQPNNEQLLELDKTGGDDPLIPAPTPPESE